MWSYFLLDNGMRLRSEWTAALHDVGHNLVLFWQPLCERSQAARYPKLISWQKSHFHSL